MLYSTVVHQLCAVLYSGPPALWCTVWWSSSPAHQLCVLCGGPAVLFTGSVVYCVVVQQSCSPALWCTVWWSSSPAHQLCVLCGGPAVLFTGSVVYCVVVQQSCSPALCCTVWWSSSPVHWLCAVLYGGPAVLFIGSVLYCMVVQQSCSLALCCTVWWSSSPVHRLCAVQWSCSPALWCHMSHCDHESVGPLMRLVMESLWSWVCWSTDEVVMVSLWPSVCWPTDEAGHGVIVTVSLLVHWWGWSWCHCDCQSVGLLMRLVMVSLWLLVYWWGWSWHHSDRQFVGLLTRCVRKRRQWWHPPNITGQSWSWCTGTELAISLWIGCHTVGWPQPVEENDVPEFLPYHVPPTLSTAWQSLS